MNKAARLARIGELLLLLPRGTTRVVLGFVVTRWPNDAFEVGTFGRATVTLDQAAVLIGGAA